MRDFCISDRILFTAILYTVNERDCDILIIGAGAAGLAAAQKLREAGKSAIVLEARDHVGGRVHTRRERGIVEAGAEFVHGEHAATWELIKSLGLPTQEWRAGESSFRVFSTGNGIRPDSETLLADMRKAEEGLYEYRGPDETVADFMKARAVSDESLFFAERHIGDLEGADAQNLGAVALASEGALATNGPRNFWITGGYDQVVRALAEGSDIRLNCAASRVEWKEGDVRVACEDGSVFTSRQLILTLPVGVLRARSVSFVPELPDSFHDAAGRIGFGNNTKLVLWLKKPLEDFGMLDSDGLFGHFWQRLFGEESVLVGYSGGSRADALASMSENDATASGIEEVAGAFGSGFKDQIAEARHFTWSNDPFTLGSYSYAPPGIGSARAELSAPIEHTIYYAGEATNAHGHTATVHGAIEAGRDVAATILKQS